MKTILVPTDYSDAANNAAEYAIELARFAKARLVLFHTYHVPVPVAEVPQVNMITYEDLEKDNREMLEKYKKKIQERASDIEVDSLISAGFAVEEISTSAKDLNADLIVMGMKGSSRLEEALVGSTTTGVIQKSEIPVMVVPEKVKYKKIKNIALACDYSEDITENGLIPKFKEFVKLFGAHVFVLNVVRPLETVSVSKAVSGIKIDHQLEDIPHTLHFPENEDLIEGINDFVAEKSPDLVVMFPRKRNIFEKLFHKSNTKKVAFHTEIPLLSLHT